MKIFLLNLFHFVLFSVSFYILSLFIWGNFAPAKIVSNLSYKKGFIGHTLHSHTRFIEVKKTMNVDILFLGSSHAYRGFDTRIFAAKGLFTFNLGTSGQTPIQTYILLKRYLEKLNPKLVIYEVDPTRFSGDGVESSLDIISNDKIDSYTFKMAYKLNHLKTYNTLLYSILRELFNLDKSYNEPIIKGFDTYISGGFVERKYTKFKPSKLQNKNIELRNSQLESFKQIISYLKSKNIDLILVFTPVTKSYYSNYQNINYYNKLIKSYSEYYNFNELLSLVDSLHFYDSHHLNQNGVKIFNEKLIEILNSR